MEQHGTNKQRSRNGCLNCRRMRKKCDERRPVCSRCDRTRTECVWQLLPRQSSSLHSDSSSDSLDDVEVGRLIPSCLLVFGPDLMYTRTTGSVCRSGTHRTIPLPQENPKSSAGCYSETLLSAVRAYTRYFGSKGLDMLESVALSSTPACQTVPMSTPMVDKYASIDATSGSAGFGYLPTGKWDYIQDYGPRIEWPPGGENGVHEFDPEGVMSVVRQSFTTLGLTDGPVFQELHNFYSVYFTRYYYDYSSVHDSIMVRVRRRFDASDSLKHGMLGTAVLFRSNYEKSLLTASLRNHAKELHQLTIHTLQLELESNCLSPPVQLAGLMELINHEYYAGNLPAYYHHLSQAASHVRAVLGANNIDLLSLAGEETFDVRLFAWCDILSSMALSRPTLLTYESDIQNSLPPETRGGHRAHPDKGVEWIFGCPDVLAVLLARVAALRHIRISAEEKICHGKEIEELIRHWPFNLVQAKDSVLMVARLGTQEIWRHAAVLYVHQTIFKSGPSHSVVKDSIKHIVRIASTLKPGVNPDCFLFVPYFIAGYFATSERDRYTLRSRVLSCGNERLLQHLALALDDIWRETDSVGGLTSWSRKHPTFIF